MCVLLTSKLIVFLMFVFVCIVCVYQTNKSMLPVIFSSFALHCVRASDMQEHGSTANFVVVRVSYVRGCNTRSSACRLVKGQLSIYWLLRLV